MGKARAGEPGLGTPGRWQDRECSCTRSRAGNRHSGAGPQSRSHRGALDSSGKPGGWKSLWLSSQPSQAWCSSLLRASNLEHQPPSDTPGTSCKLGTFVFQFSFPRTTTCSMPSLGGGCSFPLLCFQQAQPQPDGKPKAFFHSGMLQRGWEELPGHGCSAWGRSSVQPFAH